MAAPERDVIPRGRGHLTLIEVLLAVAILGGIVIFVVLPAMREAAIRRNEEAAIATLRHVYSTAGDAAFRHDPDPEPLKVPSDALRSQLIVGVPGGMAGGYRYRVDTGKYPGIHADPIAPGRTGRRFFFVNGDWTNHLHGDAVPGLLVRFCLGAPASSADSLIE